MAYTVSIGDQLVSQRLLKIDLHDVKVKSKITKMPIVKLSYTGRQWLMEAMKNPAHQLTLIPNDVMLMYVEPRTPQYRVHDQRLQYKVIISRI